MTLSEKVDTSRNDARRKCLQQAERHRQAALQASGYKDFRPFWKAIFICIPSAVCKQHSVWHQKCTFFATYLFAKLRLRLQNLWTCLKFQCWRHKVTSAIRAPSNWTPMNLYDVECKLMEARKYSHEYYDVESKFRHRNARSLQRHQIWNNLCPVNTFICYMYRESLIYWVRGFHINIASFLKRSQQQHNTPIFLKRSAQLPHPSRVGCSDLFPHGKYTQEKIREEKEFVGGTSYHIN